LDLFRARGDRAGTARIRRYQATLACHHQDWEGAERLALAALSEYEALPDRPADYPEPVTPIDQRFYPETPAPQRRGAVHNLLGSIALKRGRLDVAAAELHRALRLAADLPEPARTYAGLAPRLNLGQVYAGRGQLARARACFRRCIRSTEDGAHPDIRAAA